MTCKVHPKTGHDSRTLKPDRWGPVPGEVSVKITACAGDPDNDPPMWWAHILPTGHTCSEDKNCMIACGWMTFGNSPANALYMAYDLMSTYWDECSAAKEGGVQHCWCIDTVLSMPWDDPPRNQRFIKCCRCDHHASLEEFDAPEV
jgi:hypothetical protein